MELQKMKIGYCDNTDCKNPNNYQNLKAVEMTEDFDDEGAVVYWCKDCRERDKNMLNYVESEIK